MATGGQEPQLEKTGDLLGDPSSSNEDTGAPNSSTNDLYFTDLDVGPSHKYESDKCSKFIAKIKMPMLPFLLPLTANSEGNRLVLRVLDVNHNTLQPKVLTEIMNQILDNACKLTKSKHSKSMGRDIQMKAMYWDRVRIFHLEVGKKFVK